MNNATLKNSNAFRFIIKLTIGALLALTLFTSFIQFTSKPSYAATNSSYMTSIIHEVFGSHAAQAIRIAQCESTMNPNAVNSQAIGNSHAEGLFQILYPSTWKGTSQAGRSPFDPRANAKAAYDLFRGDGYTWAQWQCKA